MVTANVPTDYDLLLLMQTSSATADSPFENAPFISLPFISMPFISLPFISLPFISMPFISLPFISMPFISLPFISMPFISMPFISMPFIDNPLTVSPYANAGLTFEQLPLSQVGLAAPDGSFISGADIGLDELGSANLGNLLESGLEATSLSAQQGDNPEKILVQVSPGTTAVYAAIIGNNGAISAAPYALQVEGSVPPLQAQLLGERCDGEELVTSGQTGSVELLYPAAPRGDARTLIVTQRERMMATHDMTRPEFDAWLASIQTFLDHPEVLAEVISVPSSNFVQADLQPCDVQVQNAATDLVRAQILQAIAGRPFEYIQIAGGIDIIGTHYSPDEATVGYEGLFAQDLLIDPATPLAVAIAEGYNPSDAKFGTLAPLPYRGRFLYIEDVGVGRLVETPADIKRAADAFVASNGRIPIGQALISGYDFFIDGTQATEAILDTVLEDPAAPQAFEKLINDDWTGDELRCGLTPDSTDPACAVPARATLSAINFHASYNGGLSAFGFTNLDNTNLTADEVIFTNQVGMLLPNSLIMGIGCHLGMSVPNAWGFGPEIGLPIDGALDWAEQPGNLIGSWTFGLGDDTVANRGTEGLVTLVAEQLVTERQTLGEALVRAKREYAEGLVEFDVHDEKSIIGLGLFGMPQARLDITSQPPEPSFPPPPGTDPSFSASLSLSVSTSDSTGAPTQTVASVGLVNSPTGEGQFFTLENNAQGVFGRPVLPAIRVIEDRVLGPGDTRTHDVLITGGSFIDDPNFNPKIAKTVHDWTPDVQEPTNCVRTFAPSQLGVATSLSRTRPGAAAPEITENVIVLGAQFKCTLPDGATGQEVTGTLRRYEGLSVEAQRPSSPNPILDADFTPPTVAEQRLVTQPSGDVLATLDVSDPNGVRRIVALIYRDTGGNTGVMEAVDSGPLSGPGPFQLTLPNAAGVPVAFQYVDRAGNVLLKSGKGDAIQAYTVEIVSDTVAAGANSSVTIDVPGATSIEGAELAVDFGDGTFDNFMLFDVEGAPMPGVTLDVDGNARVTVPHDYSGQFGPTLTITATLQGDTATGFDSKVVTVEVLTCDADASGIVDILDVRDIAGNRGGTVPPLHPLYDPNGDGVVSVLDARLCARMCTFPRCRLAP